MTARAAVGVRACPGCGSTPGRSAELELAAVVGETPYRVVRCSVCGLSYTDPLPSEEALKALYPDEYYVSQRGSARLVDLPRRILQGVVMRWRRRRAAAAPPGRVLDVGCGNGEFLAALGRVGWQTYGTEFSSAAARLAREKGVEVREGDLAAAAFPAGFFDLVTFWHVVEHLPDPLHELGEARRLLRPGGRLVVEVPDFASPAYRLCREHWYGLDLPRHLQHLTPESLGRLLSRAGFTIVARWGYHPWDFTYTFYSLMARLGIGRLLGVDFLSATRRPGAVGSARPVARLAYLGLAVPVALASLVYSPLATWLSGHGESVTMAARRGS